VVVVAVVVVLVINDDKEPTQRTLYVDPVGVERCCAVGAQAQRHLTRPRVDWTMILSFLYFNKHSITVQ
jgi:hypothetical protein